ncbi:MAG: hypothetical protein Ct9H90mP16_14990 [Candidatus Poseidoniales archaeon]|nr:MAG: hypothetical protein Ct9H90mP16_14990 [Candidatus Poseidoniales archaeon]
MVEVKHHHIQFCGSKNASADIPRSDGIIKIETTLEGCHSSEFTIQDVRITGDWLEALNSENPERIGQIILRAPLRTWKINGKSRMVLNC